MAHEDDPLEHERASWKPSPGLAVAVPDPVQHPGASAASRADDRQGPRGDEARGPHGLHALLPLGRGEHLGDRRLHALPDRERRDRRHPQQQPLHRPRHRPRAARHRHRRDPLVEGDHVRQGVHRAPSRHARPRHDARGGRPGVRRRERGVRLRPPHDDPQLDDRRRRRLARSRHRRCSAVSRPQGEDPVDAAQPHDVEGGHAPRARPRGHADPRRRRHARLRRARHPRGARRARPRRGLPRGEGQGHRPAHAPAPRRPQRDARDGRTGRTTASSPTPRSARTSAAPSPCTSSRRTTCCAPATSRSSTSPNGAAVIFGPAARPLPQLPITVDDEGYLVARSDFTEPVGPSFWERH